MKFENQLRNDRGVSLVEIIFALGVTALLGLSIANLVSSRSIQQKAQDIGLFLSIEKSRIIAVVDNTDSFQHTIHEGVNAVPFACILNGTDCSSAGGAIQLVSFNSSTGTVTPLASTSLNPTDGISATGQPCNTFDATNGNDVCPFKYVASWTPRCEANRKMDGSAAIETRCFNPVIEISINLLYRPATPSLFGQFFDNRYQSKLLKKQSRSDGNIGVQCGMITGAVLAGDTCVLPTMGGGAASTCIGFCAAGEQALVSGFNTNGTPICTCAAAVVERNCNTAANPIGRVMLGVNPDGSLICADGLLPRLISNGSINNPAGPPPGGS